jgi:ribosome-associated protein
MTVPVEPVEPGPSRVVPGEALEAARAADEKLGEQTVVLAMGDLLGVTDAFVITQGRNGRQVRTLVDEIERRVKETSGRSPRAVEGLHDLQWVLMDYGDFLVHIFDEQTRPYYDLEHLWGDAPRVEWSANSGRPVAEP